MKVLQLSLLLAGFFWSLGAQAGVCEITVTRTACPGQEKISFKKCDGKATCAKTKEFGTEAECQKYAAKKCLNRRYEVTQLKVMKATFDKKAIKTPSGKDDFCSEDRADVRYFVDKSFPFKGKKECK